MPIITRAVQTYFHTFLQKYRDTFSMLLHSTQRIYKSFETAKWSKWFSRMTSPWWCAWWSWWPSPRVSSCSRWVPISRSSSELLLCPFHFTLSSCPPGKSISDLPFLKGDPHKCPLCWNLCFACWNRREQEGILLQTVFGTRNVYYVNL